MWVWVFHTMSAGCRLYMKSSTPAASMFYKGRAILNGLRLKLELRGSLAVLLGLLSRRLRSKMPTPSLGGREPPVDKVAGGPRTSITSESDFYTAWCRMYSHELFTPTTSAVPTVWDAFFHPPPPPPPPPRHRRSSLWDVAATVPQERPENGSEVHWSNPYGPDPPAEVAPPAAESVIEDAFQKVTKLSAISSSCRLIAPLRRTCRPHVAPLPQWRSRLSQPWQTCACMQKCRAHQNPLHCPSTTADKDPCRRAPRRQRKTTADERRDFRKHLLSTTTADKGCHLLRPHSISSTERHGHQRPRKSELPCPSTADRAC